MKALGLILFLNWVGEVISTVIRSFVAIPGSIIGMLLLFILLRVGIVKLKLIHNLVNFFLQHITLFILPFGVAFVKYIDVIKVNFMVMILCGVISTVFSFVMTMKFVDLLVIIHQKRNEELTHE